MSATPYQSIWTRLVAMLTANAALTTYLGGSPIIWGNQECSVNGNHVLVVDLAEKPIEEETVALPRRKVGRLSVFIGLKVRHQSTTTLITEILQGAEIILNALDSMYPDVSLMSVKIPTETNLNTLGTGDVKDLTFTVVLQSPVFPAGGR